jgi:hypothetical protein
VSTAGDVNGDGFSDIIVGSPYYWEKDEVSREGKAWVYLGRSSGVTSAPHWYDDCGQAGAEFGFSVSTAGDVNGDGYSDIIVGAPGRVLSVSGQGAAYVYHGSSTGLPPSSVGWSWWEYGRWDGACFGYSVSTAGDVDGDGYSDVIIGAPFYGVDTEAEEGIAQVFEGSSAGLDHSFLWEKESGQAGARFGWSVSTAGDVNGDGFADILVGAPLWHNGETNEGGAWVYHGSAPGPHTVPDWHAEGEQGGAHFGYAVSTAGDVNGDGYAEVVVGAPLYTKNVATEGQAFVFFGNEGPGVPWRLKQLSSTGPIGLLGHSHEAHIYVNLRLPSAFGRGWLQPELEVKLLGERFNGSDTWVPGGSQTWIHPFPGSGVTSVSSPLIARQPYHWRIRFVYKPGTTPWMPASRWVTPPWNGWNEQDLRTGGDVIGLPLVLRE